MNAEDAFQILLAHYDETCFFMEKPGSMSDMERSNGQQHDILSGDKSNRADWRYDRKHDANEIDFYKGIYKSTYEHPKKSPSKGEYDKRASDGKTNSQYELLVRLYNILDGDYWFHNFGWRNFSIPICEWYGVNCDEYCPHEHYVVSLLIDSITSC